MDGAALCFADTPGTFVIGMFVTAVPSVAIHCFGGTSLVVIFRDYTFLADPLQDESHILRTGEKFSCDITCIASFAGIIFAQSACIAIVGHVLASFRDF